MRAAMSADGPKADLTALSQGDIAIHGDDNPHCPPYRRQIWPAARQASWRWRVGAHLGWSPGTSVQAFSHLIDEGRGRLLGQRRAGPYRRAQRACPARWATRDPRFASLRHWAFGFFRCHICRCSEASTSISKASSITLIGVSIHSINRVSIITQK